MRIIIASLLAVAALSGQLSVDALAQSVQARCSEGRTFDGKCINPVVAAVGRQRGTCIVTRKLPGPTGGCSLPSTDVIYRDPAWFSHLRNFGLGRHGDLYIYTR
jgi:hypothetical protein